VAEELALEQGVAECPAVDGEEALVPPALAQPLRTNLDAYVVFALRNASLKDLSVLGACNTGVDCAQPTNTSSCGVLDQENPFYGDGSQMAAAHVRLSKAGASLYQVFTNLLTGFPPTIRQPGPVPPGTNPLVTPILGDVDGDGTPSCRTSGDTCIIDTGDLAAACGFPAVFPACDQAAAEVAAPGADCNPGPDSVPGNGVCDLPYGTYGTLTVQNGARLSFDGGDYAVCALVVGKGTNVSLKTPATLNVSGDVHVNNGTTFAGGCNDLVVRAAGPGGFSFGRDSTIGGSFCAPERTMHLGHNNDLTGHFYADAVNADSSDRAHCCPTCACTP
jgi:hypothetical protein